MQRYKKGEIKKVELEFIEMNVEEDVVVEKESLVLDLDTDFNVNIIHKKIIKFYQKYESDDKFLFDRMMKKKIDYLKDVKDVVDEYQYATSEIDKKEMMLKYLEKAKYYYDISYNYDEKLINKCAGCGEPEPQDFCFKCNLVCNKPKAKEIVIPKKVKKDDSEKLKNLERVMEDYEGRRPLSYEDEKLLKSILKDEKLERDQVLKMLSDRKLTPLKKQINRIMADFYGEDLPSLDDKRDILRAKFLLIDEIYNEIKPENKSNFMSINVVFYCLLVSESLSVENVDLPKTNDSRVEQMAIMTEASIILSIRHSDFNWDFEFSNNEN